jgi:protein gp37
MEKSKTGWLNGGNTFNPWIGCSPVSEACRNCYAKRETARLKAAGDSFSGVKQFPAAFGIGR